tara:strand:+ start:35 stop:298 length:264 start_codon:yes stop_codon:yes gene_type:complete
VEYSGGMKCLVMPQRTDMHKKEHGFTLIEIIIVVAIIGILFAIALQQGIALLWAKKRVFLAVLACPTPGPLIITATNLILRPGFRLT